MQLLFQLTASCTPTPGASRGRDWAKPCWAHLTAVICCREKGRRWQRAGLLLTTAVFSAERDRHWLVGLNESPSLICHWHRSAYSTVFRNIWFHVLFVQVKATLQKLSGTWQHSSSWSYSFNIFVEVKGSWDRLLPTFKKSARNCGFSSVTCSYG